MTKIPMQTPIAELDGDEMTRILWPVSYTHLTLPTKA